MTNIEFAETLEKLAAKYRESPELPMASVLIGGIYTKGELASTIKAFGGKWTKHGMDAEGEFASLRFCSLEFPPLVIFTPRSTVCKRIVTYDCEPIMSPEEEAEILA